MQELVRRNAADAALPLFLERGFDQVSVAEVARLVGVSGQTVFNYFPAKEDPVLRPSSQGRGPARHDRPRPQAGQLPRRSHPRPCPGRTGTALPGDPAPYDMLRFWQVIQASPALRAHEREIAENTEIALAAELQKDGSVPAPHLLAGAIAGIHHAVRWRFGELPAVLGREWAERGA
ncbi:helix-turn-helix domain-containing protein [Nonomuraea angiospora]|uniref:helix-turn-helix domain-containing protein n=1 Tax=Nonomuraea angiospora TaxID=46172 RepID=UPI00341547DF